MIIALTLCGFRELMPVDARAAGGRTDRQQLSQYKDSVALSQTRKTSRETGYYLHQLANLYLMQKQHKEGITYFEEWLKAHPGGAQNSDAAAASYLALGKLYLATFNKKSDAPGAFRK